MNCFLLGDGTRDDLRHNDNHIPHSLALTLSLSLFPRVHHTLLLSLLPIPSCNMSHYLHILITCNHFTGLCINNYVCSTISLPVFVILDPALMSCV